MASPEAIGKRDEEVEKERERKKKKEKERERERKGKVLVLWQMEKEREKKACCHWCGHRPQDCLSKGENVNPTTLHRRKPERREPFIYNISQHSEPI